MTPALEVRRLGYRYPDGRAALNDVSFTLGDGECLGLIGPNGAGKSTLLLHLNGLLPDTSPEPPAVFVRGRPLTRDRLEEARRQVGLLFQDPDDQLFCPTVFEDVAFGPRQFGEPETEVRARVAEALERVGLAGFEARTPHHLSAGEKQRACLAGLLACRPEILVLDEPTSLLDPRGRREFRTLLQSLEIPRLIATHDLELVVQLCPRTLVLDGGRLVADGPTPTLLADAALMDRHGLEVPHILHHRHPHG